MDVASLLESEYSPKAAAQLAQLSMERKMQLVRELKRIRRAAILAHNYQEGPIQEVADVVGDSLKLAQHALRMEEPVIVFCGVHFMAETAAMLCPQKKVLMPDPAAGCSLADMVLPEQIRAWKRQHPDGVVVCYINTSAAVKAECDYCCTSSNGEQVLQAIEPNRPILFVPDFYLGSYLKARTGRDIHLWKGYCPAHVAITPEGIERLQAQYPQAEFLMHPECGCLTKQMELADRILSTDGMIRYVRQSPAKCFIVATENGILYRMRKENPDKTFIPASPQATCLHMQRNTLDKVLGSLLTLRYPVTVEPELARRALVPLKRMLEITESAVSIWAHTFAGEESFRLPMAWGDPVLSVANDLS